MSPMMPGRGPLFTVGKDRTAGDKGHHSIDARVAPEDAAKSTTGGIVTEMALVTIFRRDEERSRGSEETDPMGWNAIVRKSPLQTRKLARTLNAPIGQNREGFATHCSSKCGKGENNPTQAR